MRVGQIGCRRNTSGHVYKVLFDDRHRSSQHSRGTRKHPKGEPRCRSAVACGVFGLVRSTNVLVVSGLAGGAAKRDAMYERRGGESRFGVTGTVVAQQQVKDAGMEFGLGKGKGNTPLRGNHWLSKRDVEVAVMQNSESKHGRRLMSYHVAMHCACGIFQCRNWRLGT